MAASRFAAIFFKKEACKLMKFKRIHLIVLDSVGIGAAHDAKNFGDSGADTLGNIDAHTSFKLPNLEKMGLGNIKQFKQIKPVEAPTAFYTKLEEKSQGKDTMTGHWELMGVELKESFKTYFNGFPPEIINQIEEFTGRKVICNLPYSGTEVINDYGKQHVEKGDLIVYTSTDSVLQIAAHEDIISNEELYKICEFVRKITLSEPNRIGRIIARPFVGEEGNYTRTSGRHDYALSPPAKTALDYLVEKGKTVWSIGKISDIFNGQGITNSVRTTSNMDGVDKLIKVMESEFEGLSFINLVDFDMLYGHRRDIAGYAEALEDFDNRIPEIIASMNEEDLLMITADHGNDPTFKGFDHTREFVPLLMYSKALKKGKNLPMGHFSNVGKTILDNFGIDEIDNAESYLKYIN